ncbi:hypothetical protein [Bradyrhizobium sp. SZCCHNRI2010]|uniref:hypothetical protein n=1 Tax=Bradyrhizobium sp. SZCCHNRI2010 TaxID=3057283 RepID=UPI0028E4AC46|nr:hypothetical protein [Bradyrhizobium sp. SZCCHNRI2010]
MSQRHSGWKRESLDRYETPAWVTAALMPHLPKRLHVWECACGSGNMVRALAAAGHTVNATDVHTGTDFLKVGTAPHGVRAVVSNPPFDQAQGFIEHAIELMKPVDGSIAMLLRIDYGCAKTRQHLFGDCPIFARKIELTRRIRWFEGTKGHPSYNHAWFVWDWQHRGEPALRYGPVATRAVDHTSTWQKPYHPMEVVP